MGYSEALEQQVRLGRILSSDAGKRLMRGIQYGLTNPRGPDGRPPVPPVDPVTLPSTAWETTANIGLTMGDTYYWAPAMCALLQASAAEIPLWTLTPDALPSRIGFAWFSSGWPLEFGDVSVRLHPGIRPVLRAVSWVHVIPHDDGRTVTIGNCQVDEGEEIYFTTWADGVVPSSPVPYHHLVWKVGTPFTAAWEATPTEIDTAAAKLKMFKTLAAMFAFIQQRILVAPKHRAERHAVKRLERDGWVHEPLIRVVELRRKASQTKASDDPVQVAWSCQWVVSGHWHQYWVGPEGKRLLQPRWVMPFVKGPLDRPLKPPRAKVFAVIR